MRVVEMSAFVAAPLAGVSLAALGADVIRIDPPGGGIDSHRWPLHHGHSLYWAGLNQGKRSVTIDTRTEAGRRTAVKIITAAGEGGGILLTNLPVSGWNSYNELRKSRQDLIMLVITGNRDGSTAVDYTVNAALGFPFLTGPEGHEGPINHVLPAWDGMTGFVAVAGLIAAERHRLLTGQGQLVEVSLSDVGLAVSSYLGFLPEAILTESPRARFGNSLFGTFGRDFATQDGRRVIVLALTSRQWRSLANATGLNERLVELEKSLHLDFEDEGHRWRGRVEIGSLLEPWIAQRTLAEVGVTFDRLGVLWGPYQTFKQLLAEDPRASLANPLFAEVEHPAVARYLTPGSPLRFGVAAAVPPKPAPRIGQHTHEVLNEFGLDDT
jgi:2-methylfumaryl-CoA isomerase